MRRRGFITNRTGLTALSLAIVALVFAGCASSAFEPATGANVRDDGAIVEADESVNVVIALGSWSGRSEIRSEVEPVEVTVTNTSERAIEVGPRDFELRSEEVEIRAANLDRWRGEIRVPASTVTDNSVRNLNATVDTGSAGATLVVVELPSREMRAKALKDTVLEPGESISGFLFFPEIDDLRSEKRIDLHGTFRDQATNEIVSDVYVPLVTD